MSEPARDPALHGEPVEAATSRIGARASGPAPERGRRVWGYLVFALFVLVIGTYVWGTDFVTPDGEWTIYTARCDRGQWVGAS